MNRSRSWRRVLTHLELGLAVACVALAIAWPSLAPTMRGGMFESRFDVGPVVTFAGILGTVVGTAWVFRIANADPEAGPSPWRYRGED